MEPTIQGYHAMRTRSKDIASHSVQTGSKYYDESAATFRCSAMHFINEGEIEYETQTDVPEEIQSKRLKLDEEGKKANLEKARLRVEKDPSKRKATTGKSSSVVPIATYLLTKRLHCGHSLFTSRKVIKAAQVGQTSRCPQGYNLAS